LIESTTTVITALKTAAGLQWQSNSKTQVEQNPFMVVLLPVVGIGFNAKALLQGNSKLTVDI
jgi:hypothetical protein